MLQGAAADCNSAGETHAWFDSRVAHHSSRHPRCRQDRLDAATPAWFYVLREAELTGGNHLGPLGSHLVANTLIGLVVNDAGSYWNAKIDGHRWSPHLFQPSQPIDSLKAMLRFTGLLA